MGTCDPAEAVEVLDLLLKFFGNGERWVRGRLSDRRGNRCLIGALDFVSSHRAIKGDAAERYLADEVSAATACNDDTMTLPDSEPAFAVLCPEDGIGSARLSCAGTVFLILTTDVRTSLSCGRSSFKRGRQR